MTETHLAQSEGYSGASHPGLNREASYHRMVYEDRTTIHTIESASSLLPRIQQEFIESDRSRLVARFLLEATQESIHIYADELRRLGGTVSWYQDRTPRNDEQLFFYITYGKNNIERDIPKETVEKLTLLNQQYIARILTSIGADEEFRLVQLRQFQKKGFALVQDIEPEELSTLWQSFGWSLDACRDILESRGEDLVLGVRDAHKKLIATLLYSHQPHILSDGTTIRHGELTEAATLPEYRGNGIMGILSSAAYVKALENQIFNIYGEYRTLGSRDPHAIQSLKFALESGVHFPSGDMLLNHVDIEDVVDPHNFDRKISGYGGAERQLKSFMLGSLDPNNLTPAIQQAYLEALIS